TLARECALWSALGRGVARWWRCTASPREAGDSWWPLGRSGEGRGRTVLFWLIDSTGDSAEQAVAGRMSPHPYCGTMTDVTAPTSAAGAAPATAPASAPAASDRRRYDRSIVE